LQPGVEPAGEALSDYEILRRLAPRVGLGAEFARSTEEWKRILLGKAERGGLSFEKLAQGAQRDPNAPAVPYEERKFETASSKVQLIHDAQHESSAADPLRPLSLMALATEKSQASQWSPEAQQGPALCRLHPAAAEGFSDGEKVRLESEVGSLVVLLKFDSKQRRDVALMDKGGWHRSGRSANALVRARCTDAGGGARYYDTPVRLLPLE
jgi:anaerobic selenocysteine-containing dehydrogenase